MSGTYYSVGHSNHSLEAFVSILARHHIEVIADVRSYPMSRVVPHFNRESLQQQLRSRGFRYVFLGEELGGRPTDPDCYDREGHVLYSMVAESPTFLAGISRLSAGIRDYRVATMCSEENPTSCHRRLLVGRVMISRGASLLHLRGNGQLQLEAEISYAEEPKAAPGLFPASDPWRSRAPLRHKVRPFERNG